MKKPFSEPLRSFDYQLQKTSYKLLPASYHQTYMNSSFLLFLNSAFSYYSNNLSFIFVWFLYFLYFFLVLSNYLCFITLYLASKHFYFLIFKYHFEITIFLIGFILSDLFSIPICFIFLLRHFYSSP